MKKIIKKLTGSIAVKSLSGIILLLVVFSIVTGFIGYYGFTEAFRSQYDDSAFHTASVAAAVIDPDLIEDYKDKGKNADTYKSVHDRLEEICNATDSTFIYVIQPDTKDYWHITFLFSTVNEELSYTEFEFGYVRETTNEDYQQKYRALYEEGSQQELVLRDQGYISTNPHITAMVPLKGSDGETKAILCVQGQMEVLAAARRSYVRRILMSLVFILVITIFIQWMYLHRMILFPIKKITDEASRFAAENIAGEKKLRDIIHNHDEIGLLAGSVDQMEVQVIDYVNNLTKAAAEKEKIITELSLAARIQAAMLPDDFPAFPDRHEFDLYAIMDPAKDVGGDFYDFFLIDDDHLYMVIADVSGKGIPAALYMMASEIILKNYAIMYRSPSRILEEANNAICSRNREEMFVTVWLGILEISSGILTAANAGHEYPILKTPGGKFELLKDKHGFVLGGMKDLKYKDYKITLEPGSTLFLYTDGVPEASDTSDHLFGIERTVDALNLKPDADASEVLTNVRKAVDDFIGNAEQFDDLTMMCLEYKKN